MPDCTATRTELVLHIVFGPFLSDVVNVFIADAPYIAGNINLCFSFVKVFIIRSRLVMSVLFPKIRNDNSSRSFYPKAYNVANRENIVCFCSI